MQCTIIRFQLFKPIQIRNAFCFVQLKQMKIEQVYTKLNMKSKREYFNNEAKGFDMINISIKTRNQFILNLI